MTVRSAPMCFECKRRTGIKLCTAFPGGIPDDIWFEGEAHYESRAGEETFLAESPAAKRQVEETWPRDPKERRRMQQEFQLENVREERILSDITSERQ